MNRLQLSAISLVFIVIVWLVDACQTPAPNISQEAQEVAIQNGPVVDIIALDSSLKIVPTGQRIALLAQYSPTDGAIQWQLTGSGKLIGETGTVIQYEAPATISAEEQVMVVVIIKDSESKRTAQDSIVITLLPPTPTPKPPDTPTSPVPDTSTPTNTLMPTPTSDPSLTVLTLTLTDFITQTVSSDGEFFLDTTSGAVPNLPTADGVDLSGYRLELTFQGGDGAKVQLFFKNLKWKNVYCLPTPITSGQSIRCDPSVDQLNVEEFKDFTHIYAVGAKVSGGTQGIKITSARLIRSNAPDLGTPTPTSG